LNIAKENPYQEMSFELPVSPRSEDAELSQLYKRETKKFHEARMKMKGVGGGVGRGVGGGVGGGIGRSRGHDYDIDITDMTDQDIAIVCEELWVDIKRWVGLHKNLCSCGEKVYKSVVRNLVMLLCIAAFLITFRWYVGAGKDACSYGVGWGVFSLMCEVMRYAGEFLLAALIGICGFCCGLLPIIVCVCVYEGVDDDNDDGAGAGVGVKEKSE
jgi:hypothetical protein